MQLTPLVCSIMLKMYYNSSSSTISPHSWQTEELLTEMSTQGPWRIPVFTKRQTTQPTARGTTTWSRPPKSHSENLLWILASLNSSHLRPHPSHPDTYSPCLCLFLLKVASSPQAGDPLWAGRVWCLLICWMNWTQCWIKLGEPPRTMTDRRRIKGERDIQLSVWTMTKTLQCWKDVETEKKKMESMCNAFMRGGEGGGS